MRPLLLLALALAGCMKRAPADTEDVTSAVLAVSAPLDPGLLGTWDLDSSTAVWTITATSAGQVVVTGVDSSDGEPFEVSSIRPDGRTLRFSTRMPSTEYTTAQTWTLTEDGRCTVLIQSDSAVTLSATRRAGG